MGVSVFFDLALTSFRSVATVFVTGIIAYLVLAGLDAEKRYMTLVSALLKRVALPCLIFHSLVTGFDTGDVPLWWVYPLAAVGINIVGFALASLYIGIDRSIRFPGEFRALTAFQNGMFLPLAFAPMFFGADALPEFLNRFFLFHLLSVPSFFTFGVWLVNTGKPYRVGIRDLLSLPVVATVVGFLFAVTGLGTHLPGWFLEPVGTVGTLTTPLSMLFVGGVIVTNIPAAKPDDWLEPIKVTVLKTLVFPLITIAALALTHPSRDFGFLIMLQTAMPSAIFVALIAPDDGRNQQIIAGGILVSHLVSIVTIPLFMGLFGLIYG